MASSLDCDITESTYSLTPDTVKVSTLHVLTDLFK
jgi:hypothetical protein